MNVTYQVAQVETERYARKRKRLQPTARRTCSLSLSSFWCGDGAAGVLSLSLCVCVGCCSLTTTPYTTKRHQDEDYRPPPRHRRFGRCFRPRPGLQGMYMCRWLCMRACECVRVCGLGLSTCAGLLILLCTTHVGLPIGVVGSHLSW